MKLYSTTFTSNYFQFKIYVGLDRQGDITKDKVWKYFFPKSRLSSEFSIPDAGERGEIIMFSCFKICPEICKIMS